MNSRYATTPPFWVNNKDVDYTFEEGPVPLDLPYAKIVRAAVRIKSRQGN